jgi:hypothetical protein
VSFARLAELGQKGSDNTTHVKASRSSTRQPNTSPTTDFEVVGIPGWQRRVGFDWTLEAAERQEGRKGVTPHSAFESHMRLYKRERTFSLATRRVWTLIKD